MADATKRCCTCHELKALAEFNVRRRATDGLQSRCRSCSAAWYQANRDAHRANVARNSERRRHENTRLLVAYLRENPCVDCGEGDLRVLDFDHRDPTLKTENVGRLLASALSWERILQEIEKCDVRCANCHRRRTAELGGWARHREQVALAQAAASAASERLARLSLPQRPSGPPAVRTSPGVWRLLPSPG